MFFTDGLEDLYVKLQDAFIYDIASVAFSSIHLCLV